MLVIRQCDISSLEAAQIADEVVTELREHPEASSVTGTVLIGPGPPGCATLADVLPRIAVLLPGQRVQVALRDAAAQACDVVVTPWGSLLGGPVTVPVLEARGGESEFLTGATHEESFAAVAAISAAPALYDALKRVGAPRGPSMSTAAALADSIILAADALRAQG